MPPLQSSMPAHCLHVPQMRTSSGPTATNLVEGPLVLTAHLLLLLWCEVVLQVQHTVKKACVNR